tara:strand:+ start:435 stop:773 length:339 start_codon:yes stop_codon:yes gene_type:complete
LASKKWITKIIINNKKMKKLELRQLIREEVKKTLKEDGEHYMFFENLKIIKKAVDEMLNLDKQMVDDILSDGHDWAEDHIATSKDDVEEVYNFLIHKKAPTGLEEKKQLSSK